MPAVYVTRICKQCQKEFEIYTYRLKNGGGKYCSRRCQEQYKSASLFDRFFRLVGKITETGCILWEGKPNKDGYGTIHADAIDGKPGEQLIASRVAYELLIGPIPDLLHVLHRCDVPLCINPAHLFAGTEDTNAKDKVAKGRQYRGERHHRAKLKIEEIKTIRRRCAAGEARPMLAHEYDVTPANIRAIDKRESWSWVE